MSPGISKDAFLVQLQLILSLMSIHIQDLIHILDKVLILIFLCFGCFSRHWLWREWFKESSFFTSFLFYQVISLTGVFPFSFLKALLVVISFILYNCDGFRPLWWWGLENPSWASWCLSIQVSLYWVCEQDIPPKCWWAVSNLYLKTILTFIKNSSALGMF